MFQVEFVSREKSPLVVCKKQHKNFRLIRTLLVTLVAVLALTIVGCSDISIPDENQTTAQESTRTAKPVKTMKFGGSSMEPTLRDGDKVDIFSIDRELRRTDLVFFTSPEKPDVTMIKRIVGLPNETIEIKNGEVLINGVVLNEPYIAEPISYTYASTVIPDKSYFILGDNRNHSSDSHNFGFVPITNVQYIAVKK